MFVFRADGNSRIGLGHLMRCLTIADEVRKRPEIKEQIIFICADKASGEFVRAHGYDSISLGTNPMDMESELPAIKNVIETECENIGSDAKDNVIVVDSYYVTEEYLKKIRDFGRVVLLDDMQQQCYPVDAVINYNAFASADIYKKLYADSHTGQYIGSEYVPIRPQFVGCDYTVREQVRDVLITTGGGDADNIAGVILARLNDCSNLSELKQNNNKLTYHLIMSKFNPNISLLEEITKRCSWVHLHVDVKNMASLMKMCDIAVTAGGTTIYELAAVGVPFICFSYAKNQELLTKYIGDRNIASYAGKYHISPDATLECIHDEFESILQSLSKRNNMYLRERSMVDGLGAQRLAQKICELKEY